MQHSFYEIIFILVNVIDATCALHVIKYKLCSDSQDVYMCDFQYQFIALLFLLMSGSVSSSDDS